MYGNKVMAQPASYWLQLSLISWLNISHVYNKAGGESWRKSSMAACVISSVGWQRSAWRPGYLAGWLAATS
jgi:hypothetical protein